MKTPQQIKQRIKELKREGESWTMQDLVTQAKAFKKAAKELEWCLE